MCVAIALVAISALSTLVARPEPAHAADRPSICAHRGKTVLANRTVRVYRVPASGPFSEGMEDTYGCYRGTGRSWNLEGDFSGGVLQVWLSGRFVAYDLGSSSSTGCVRELTTRDLLTGAAKVGDRSSSCADITDLVLKPNGSVAWIRGEAFGPGPTAVFPTDAPHVRRRDAAGSALLDRALNIDPRSLVLIGPYVRWRKGGQFFRAPLR